MKTKYDTLKTSVIGTIAATLMAVSAQGSASDQNVPIWAGQFKAAYDSTSEQTRSTGVHSSSSSVEDAIVWAGHFERAYGPSSQRTDVATGPGRVNIIERLLWAGHFKDAYQPAQEETLAKGGSIEVAMDR